MRTRMIRADRLTTRDQLVENTPRRRVARPIESVHVNDDISVTVRVPGDPVARVFSSRDKVRVLDTTTTSQRKGLV